MHCHVYVYNKQKTQRQTKSCADTISILAFTHSYMSIYTNAFQY